MGTIAPYQYYRDLIIFTQRGNYRGRISNAKPIFVISLIDAIEKKIFVDNRLLWGNSEFEEIYYKHSKAYHNRTRIILPFFHLDTSEYFHVKWRQKYQGLSHTPSIKFMKDNVEYAYLDNALWDLLQDKDIRELMKSEIIRFFKLESNN